MPDIGIVSVRPFREPDVPALLALMKALARFEGYIDDFWVTEADLVRMGLGERPAFAAYVAEQAGGLVGYAVCYKIPFTYRMQPTVVLKELFVSAEARAGGVGRQLFGAVASHAKEDGAALLEWLVLPHNEAAKDFYRTRGGRADASWERWHLTLACADRQ